MPEFTDQSTISSNQKYPNKGRLSVAFSAIFKHKKIYIPSILVILALTFTFLLQNDIKKIRQSIDALYQTQEKPNENVLADGIKPFKKCEYKDVIHEIIQGPDVSDDIQDIIGHQNNKVGLYIYAEVEDFVDLADEMINSNGGEWGYVLIPYNVKDENLDRWSHLFELLSEKKLIPIIQLWDLDINDIAKRDAQIKASAEFLNKLKWPIKKRYVSAYNETNDANFWKGKLDPEGYAVVLDKTITQLKLLDPNFFVMNGAFNSSARTGGDYLDIRDYLRRMDAKVPGIFKRIDGWASHPYPQPNFSGPVTGTGRDSIKAYDWELAFLKTEFKVETTKTPVFITETGWAHKEGKELDDGNRVPYALNQYQVADNFKTAFETVWGPDEKVVAVTPFTIRYNAPYDHFSWVDVDNKPYPQFLAVKNLKKKKGKPPVVTYTLSKSLDCVEEKVAYPK